MIGGINMADLKELLGELYTPELEASITAAYIPNDGSYIPKANSEGEARRLKKERDDAIAKARELEEASLSADEKAQKAIDDAIAKAKATETASLKMMSKLELQTGLASSGIDLSKHADILELLVGDNPETAKSISAGLQQLITEATTMGEARANETHLKNNGTPGGGTNAPLTLEDYQKMTLDDRMKLSHEQPDVYKSLTQKG